jgi:hypothetical protein
MLKKNEAQVTMKKKCIHCGVERMNIVKRRMRGTFVNMQKKDHAT